MTLEALPEFLKNTNVLDAVATRNQKEEEKTLISSPT